MGSFRSTFSPEKDNRISLVLFRPENPVLTMWQEMGVDRDSNTLCFFTDSAPFMLWRPSPDPWHCSSIHHSHILIPAQWTPTQGAFHPETEVHPEKKIHFYYLQNISKSKALVSTWHVTLYLTGFSIITLMGIVCRTGPCLALPFPSQLLSFSCLQVYIPTRGLMH